MSRQGKKWTQKEIEYLEKHYGYKSRQEIADALGRTKSAIKGAIARYNLKSPNDGTFKKGHTPYNKGKAQEEYMSKEALERVRSTQFKKGRKPHNTKHDGHISIRVDKTGIPYKHIRIEESHWMLYHRFVWQEHYEAPPEGMNITFKNGCSLDCRIENLELISDAELAQRNHNREKQSETMKRKYANGWDPGQKSLSDSYVAGLLARGDYEHKDEIMKHYPEMIELKRKQLQLNRQINHEQDKS